MRLRPAVGPALIACALALAGCKRRTPATPPPPFAVGAVAQGGTTAWHLDRGGNALVIVWADADIGGGGGASGANVHGTIYLSPKGESLDIRTDTPDGKSGAITIGAAKYDLSQGSIFLAYTKDRPLRVVQLQQHPPGVKSTTEGLRGFAQSHPQIQAFLENAAKEKAPATSGPE